MNKGILQITTSAQKELIDITHKVNTILPQCSSDSGILYLFTPHTTAGLTINEGADPDVQTDIISGLSEIVPCLNFKHAEGNSPAHIMTLLTGSSLTIQIEMRQLQLGTWQRIFFCEYDGPRVRSLNWKFLPDV
jgi:secondary thiamine-phosphate synthase enzyme